jgi:hypothetical protein
MSVAGLVPVGDQDFRHRRSLSDAVVGNHITLLLQGRLRHAGYIADG